MSSHFLIVASEKVFEILLAISSCRLAITDAVWNCFKNKVPENQDTLADNVAVQVQQNIRNPTIL